MAQNYSIINIVGVYGPSYEALFNQVNTDGSDRIKAGDAAVFMKRSGLSDLLLAKIWEISDWESRGSLDKHGWFVAMKLIALAQAGKDVSVGNLQLDIPPPRLSGGETQNPSATVGGVGTQRRGSDLLASTGVGVGLGVGAGYYPAISSEDRFKYERVFDSQQPLILGGKPVLGGDKVRMVLSSTNLPTDKLAAIWELSDIDHDGALDRDEFVVAMHLVQRTMEGVGLPRSLPSHLLPPAKQSVGTTLEPRRGSMLGDHPLGQAVGVSGSVNVNWAVPESDRVKFESMFRAIDTDFDGLVNGAECRDLLMRSNLAQPVLAQIWGLCDTACTGKLNLEQFILAMHLIQRKVLGQEVPTSLPPELIPPSMRNAAGLTSAPPGGPVMIGSIPIVDPKLLEFKEMQELKSQFDSLRSERAAIEKQRTQDEGTIRLYQNELSMLQREFESVTTTVRQLEQQKGEAQKRLDELAERTRRLRASANEMRERADAERRECESLRNSVGAQSTNRREREEEVAALRSALNAVTQEEHALNDRLIAVQSECDRLARTIRETVSNTDRVRQTISKYEEQKTQLTKLIGQIRAGQQPASYLVTQALEDIPEPPELPSLGFSASSNYSAAKLSSAPDDAFGGGSAAAAAASSGFSNVNFNANFESGFGNSAFTGASAQRSADPFASPQSDPFSGDPFGFGSFGSQKQADPFGSSQKQADPFAAFGSDDPFSSNARTSSPAPPRPAKGPGIGASAAAPPRPAKPPATSSATSSGWPDDPFGAAFGSADSNRPAQPAAASGANFSAFADFDSFGSNTPWN